MPRKKKVRLCCPAPDCSGGYSNRIYEVSEKVISKIPTEILERKERNALIYRCNYCGFVWAKRHSRRIGVDVVPLGFYDNSQNPNTFVPVPEDYETKL